MPYSPVGSYLRNFPRFEVQALFLHLSEPLTSETARVKQPKLTFASGCPEQSEAPTSAP